MLATRLYIFMVDSSVADSGSGAFLTPGSGMGKKSGSGSGINHPDHIYECLEIIFWVEILKFFDAYPGATLVDSEKYQANSSLRML
jgi:hypothetical protein